MANAPANAKKDEPANAPPASTGAKDVLFLHSPTEDGEGVRVIRAKDDAIEAGEVRPMKEGRPIVGEVVKLVPRASSPRVCDVEVLAKVETPARDRAGPAQVATPAYRESWDRIFSTTPSEELPN